MDTESPPPTVTRKEAAALLGISERTLDRYIPVGTPGRSDYRDTPGPVKIELRLIRALMPTPGGDDVV